MGACGSANLIRERRTNRIKDGIPISDTNYARSTQHLPIDSELPASNYQSSVNDRKAPHSNLSNLGVTVSPKPPMVDKQMSSSSLQPNDHADQLSRQSSNIASQQLAANQPGTVTSQSPNILTPVHQPNTHQRSPSLDTLTLDSAGISTQSSVITPPNALNRGSIRSLNRQRSHPTSTSPVVSGVAVDDNNQAFGGASSGPSSPLRRELSARGVPPQLNLQSRQRFPRDVDPPETMLGREDSPRHSARDKQAAAVRTRLQQGSASPLMQSTLAPGQSANNSSIPSPSSAATGAASLYIPHANDANTLPSVTLINSDWTTAVERPGVVPDPASKDSRRGVSVLNPRRGESAQPDSPVKTSIESALNNSQDAVEPSRFLAPSSCSRQSSFSRRATNNSVSQAIDLIDASPNVMNSSDIGGGGGGISRRSLRASRQSLNQLYNLSSPNSVSNNPSSSTEGRRAYGLRGGKKLALLIDSNTLSQRLTLVTLHRAPYNYTCDTCASGEEALKLVKSNRYELILIDSSPLPSLSTVETVKLIRLAEEERGEVPTLIVNITSNVDAASLASYKAAGMSASLQTGVLVEQLPATIEALSHNPNYLFLSTSLVKQQEPRTAEQEQAEATALLARGERSKAYAEQRNSVNANNRNSASSNFLQHQPEGHAVRSNRRTTSTGRTFNGGPPSGVTRKVSGASEMGGGELQHQNSYSQQESLSIAATTVTSLEQHRPSFISVVSLQPSVSSNNFVLPPSSAPHSPSSQAGVANGSPYFSTPSPATPNALDRASPILHADRDRSSPNSLAVGVIRRASLSIHSLKENSLPNVAVPETLKSKTGQT